MHKKIKVVFVINNFLVGGVERLFFDIISFFDKEKYDIQIVTVFGTGPLENSFRGLGIPIYFAGPSWFFSRELSFKLYWPFIAPLTLIRITFFLLKSKPDVVISSLYQADIFSMIATKIIGIKKRILVQLDVAHFGKIFYFIKKGFAIPFATQIVAGSETIKDFLIEYFKVKEEKITRIYNGINYERFKKGIKLIPRLDNPIIGIVGRLEEIKGQIYVLEAMKILKDKNNLYPTVFFAGEGSLRNDLEKYTIENNLNNIKFFGNVDNVPEFLSQIDILIVPSISEGFGLVVLEGMVSRKVVIASDIEVMNELIKDGETGFLFKSKNAESLANVLLKILNNIEVCEKIQKNAFLYAGKNRKIFDIPEVSKNYQNLLTSI